MERVELKNPSGLEAWLPFDDLIYYCPEDNTITEGFWSKGTVYLGTLQESYEEYLECEILRLEKELLIAKT